MRTFFKYLGLVFFFIFVGLIIWGRLHHREAVTGESPYKIYVAMGFHSNLYHSWRGDTLDEAGFGTDIRLPVAVRSVAGDQGLLRDPKGLKPEDVKSIEAFESMAVQVLQV